MQAWCLWPSPYASYLSRSFWIREEARCGGKAHGQQHTKMRMKNEFALLNPVAHEVASYTDIANLNRYSLRAVDIGLLRATSLEERPAFGGGATLISVYRPMTRDFADTKPKANPSGFFQTAVLSCPTFKPVDRVFVSTLENCEPTIVVLQARPITNRWEKRGWRHHDLPAYADTQLSGFCIILIFKLHIKSVDVAVVRNKFLIIDCCTSRPTIGGYGV
jgi:hypothetical protein